MKSSDTCMRAVSTIELELVGGGCRCVPGDPCVTNTGAYSGGNQVLLNCGGGTFGFLNGYWWPIVRH